MSIKNDIRRWRKAKGFTFLQAAVALGVQPSTVQRWEAGMKPKGLSLERIREVIAKGK